MTHDDEKPGAAQRIADRLGNRGPPASTSPGREVDDRDKTIGHGDGQLITIQDIPSFRDVLLVERRSGRQRVATPRG
ncbi:hypothetical protein AB0H18_06980 [Streptomyces sp. NPDC020766]|uniref:hypothetical protein n=1 Tax=Streptomyces sp. NPDC020766 TaxID=3155011 RepID=UPI0033EF8B78